MSEGGDAHAACCLTCSIGPSWQLPHTNTSHAGAGAQTNDTTAATHKAGDNSTKLATDQFVLADQAAPMLFYQTGRDNGTAERHRSWNLRTANATARTVQEVRSP